MIMWRWILRLRSNYARAAGLPHIDISRIEESIGILKSSGIPYEFRTTVVKGIHTVAEFEKSVNGLRDALRIIFRITKRMKTACTG